MKALVIMKDAQFLYVGSDQEFLVYLSNLKKSYLKNLKNSNSENSNKCDKVNEYDMLEFYMMPLVGAFLTLEANLNEACSSVVCADGSTAVFQKHSHYIYIGIGNTDIFNIEEELNRELSFLFKLIRFLYGPFGHLRLTSSSTSKKIIAKQEISLMMETYILLCKTDSTFLMEAVELMDRLNGSDLNIHSLLKKYTKTFRKKSQLNVQYGLIFVDSKLLAMDKGGNKFYDLSMTSMLQIMCLMAAKESINMENSFKTVDPTSNKNVKNYQEENKEVSSETVTNENGFENQNNAKENVDINGDSTEKNEITPETNTKEQNDILIKNFQDDENSINLEDNAEDDDGKTEDFISDVDSDFSGDIQMDGFQISLKVDPKEMSKAYQHVSQYSEGNTNNIENGDEASVMDLMNIKEDHFTAYEQMSDRNKKLMSGIPAFLSSSRSPFIPYTLHCIAMSEHVKIVFLSKVDFAPISDCVCGMYNLLQKIEFTDTGKLDVVNGQNTVKTLEKCNKVLYSFTKKLNKRLSQHGRKIYETWCKDGQRNLQTFFKSGEGEYLKILERCIPLTEKYLRSLFENLFPSFEVQNTSQTNNFVLKQILSDCKINLQDYQKYLELKSQQNYPLLHFLPKFPGLVHFSAVKRCRNIILHEPLSDNSILIPDELISSAASFNEPFTQERMEKYANKAFSNIAQGIMETTILDKDFRFTSLIWLSVPNKSLYPLQTFDVTESYNLPYSSSLFSGDIFRHFLLNDNNEPAQTSYKIYHMMCVHFSMVPISVIKSQASELFKEISNSELSK